MANNILHNSDVTSTRQQEILDSLTYCLHKAQSLSEVAANCDFCTYPPAVVQGYCCVISDLLDEAVQLSHELH